MTDYWKSHERHYCKYCNAWMQGDKISIRHHEQGRKHRDMMQEFFKQKRKTKSEAAHSDRDLQKQLQDIDQAAQARFAQDMASGAVSGLPPPPPPARPGMNGAPPPPPRRDASKRPQGGGGGRGGGGGGGPRSSDRATPSAPAEDAGEEPVAEDGKGIYEVRGVVYLEGKQHETQLIEGSACQVWVEDVEEWLDALIDKVTAHEIPNTALVFRKFTITYMLPHSSSPVTEQDLRSDRLRIKLPQGMTMDDAEAMVAKMAAQAATGDDTQLVIEDFNKHMDETTGMGEWSTVSVVQIDESEEVVAQRQMEEEVAAAQAAEEEKRREALEDFAEQGDDALGAFNPWGGSYKGVQLDSSSRKQQLEEEIQITTDGNVDFKKKRKALDTNKKKKRSRRTEDDDD
ncbi:TPA: hypothetical protein N0F65_008946 [Lagenidium giganteum]|uniref:Matrin-type domain-containing protein n=1 Tax=Lagenidium giganteum TaxID=4803 RepID=A0AAV2YXC5_9STRA|nr:TPA: hypothetical protein N0F65_008946 [Lagenidium giganteum]